MATMIPDSPSPTTESRAEIRLFDALRDLTPNAYVAFHHVAWLMPGPRGAQQGEADFVLAHPQLGIAVIEVKGGGIRYEGQNQKWYSMNPRGEVEIKDPFEQARRSSWALADLLRPPGGPRPTIGYAVSFPDVTLDNLQLRPDAPREIVIGGNHLAEDLPKRLAGMYSWWYKTPPGADVTRLRKLLGNSFEIRAPLAIELDEDERRLMRLTEDQFRILDLLARQTRVAIGGCAGSGKTVLAAEKARRLAAQGFDVLLICFNRLLAEYLRRHLADEPRIQAFAYDEMCEYVVRAAGATQKVPRPADVDYWPRLRTAFADLAVNSSIRYDALIVDEGQDIDDDWWLPLQILLKDPDTSPLYIFFDDNQRLFRRAGLFPVAGASMQLVVNCRNTKSIHDLVSHYYDGPTVEALGPRGLPIDWHLVKTAKDVEQFLDAHLTKLRTEAGLAPNDIALLTAHGTEQGVLWRTDKLGGWRLTDDPWDNGAVLRASIARFKGLERKVVIAVELDGASEHLLYVLFSRPSVYLCVVATPAMLKQLPWKVRKKLESAN
jgi:thymidylate kinase